METPPIVHTMELSISRARSPFLKRYEIWGVLTLSLIFIAGVVFGIEYIGAVSNTTLRENTAAVAASDPFAGLDLKAQAVYVYDIKAEEVLYERSADVQWPLASITKVPLAIVVSEVLSSTMAITIPRDTAPKGNRARLAAGEVWRVQDILDYTLVSSSNIGAEILAEVANEPIRARFPGAPEEATLWRMNQLMQELGLSNTYFLNPSGLDLSTTQSGAYGSARNVGSLFAYASTNWASVFSRTSRDDIHLTSIGGTETSAFNTDEAIEAIPGLIMGKTGFTDLAGGNLAVVFDVGLAHPVVAVVLGSTYDGRFEDIKKIVAASRQAISAR